MLKRTLLMAAALWVTQPALSAEQKVTDYRLDNGMKVVVIEDNRSPVVVQQVWYKVGSTYEKNGTTGLSHMLEHMMFKGTKTLKPGEFSEIVALNGGRENAFTSRDYTAYFQTVASDRLELMMKLEADRMRNVQIIDDEFYKERSVVTEERRMRTDDNPKSALFEQFMANAFISSPVRNPVIGWRADIDAYTAQDMRDWYQEWYAPNNATLVVAGDVKPEQVLAWAKQYYGVYEEQAITPPKPQAEIPQQGTRRFILKRQAKVPYLLIGFKTPTLSKAKVDWEPYALEVLAGVLDGGRSARLAKNLVRGQQIASSAGAGYDLYDRLEGLFIMDGIPANGKTVAGLETALLAQVKQVQTDGVEEQELDRVKAQVLAANIYERDSMFYQAMKVGVLETVGLGYKTLDEYVERIQQVTPEQVQAVAKKYLLPERMTVGVLEPLPLSSKGVNRHAH